MDQQHYKINAPQIVHEVIDGEAIIINLESGNYYSLQHSGSTIWHLIGQGWSTRRIITELSRLYRGTSEDMEQGITELIEELQQENLIIPCDDHAVYPEQRNNEIISDSEKKDFTKPVLESFSDMQDILLLDPIHEVDDSSGWPNPPNDSAE
ncbi:PqqD family protein [candidate division CSSED10-310 bacterium]|uniref:PqqD family protein n=1 Tax=candidate division CSSED10-310 bacterium TaxID=2855610 RepID=A0ABV6Z0S8_UNCC1